MRRRPATPRARDVEVLGAAAGSLGLGSERYPGLVEALAAARAAYPRRPVHKSRGSLADLLAPHEGFVEGVLPTAGLDYDRS